MAVRAGNAALIGIPGVLALGGCAAPYPLHANLSDTELRQRLDENFPPGTSVEQTQQKLTELRVKTFYRKFEQDDPPVLRVRLFEPGGPWPDQRYQWVKWVDAYFVFNRERLLDHTETNRGETLFFERREASAPAPKYQWRPPADSAAPESARP